MGPEMTDLFVRYKELKKYLKAMKKQKQPGAQLQTLLQAYSAHLQRSFQYCGWQAGVAGFCWLLQLQPGSMFSS
jgi:hypothetical protein